MPAWARRAGADRRAAPALLARPRLFGCLDRPHRIKVLPKLRVFFGPVLEGLNTRPVVTRPLRANSSHRQPVWCIPNIPMVRKRRPQKGRCDVTPTKEVKTSSPHGVGREREARHEQTRSEEGGDIVACDSKEARSSEQAIRLAVSLATQEGHCGAIAFSRTGDPALGDFEDAVILKTVGEVDIGLLST
jgi:hypothetical protein